MRNFNTEYSWKVLLLVVSILAVIFIYYDYLVYMVSLWIEGPERIRNKFFLHCHGIAFAPLALVIIANYCVKKGVGGSDGLVGVVLLLVGLLLGIIGNYSAVYYVANCGLLLVLVGLLVIYYGFDFVICNWEMLLVLLLIIPLPQFVLIRIYTQLSSYVATISVIVSQAIGLTVFMNGNMIEFGDYVLHVIDAGRPVSYLFFVIVTGLFIGYFVNDCALRKFVVILSGPVILFFLSIMRIVCMVWIGRGQSNWDIDEIGKLLSGPLLLIVVTLGQVIFFVLPVIRDHFCRDIINV